MCKVCLGSSGEGTIMVSPSKLEIVRPRKNNHVKILGGLQVSWSEATG
ncbi:unnamed protein product [Arabidopsis halleri]